MKQLWAEFIHAIWLVLKLPVLIVIKIFKYWFQKGWKSLALFITAAIVVTIVVIFSFLELTSQPGFCNNCHIMRPYIAAWETSSHADVHCMKCHAGMGVQGYLETKMTAVSMLANYFTGIYKRSRPWAEIEDANCLQGGCHETRLLEGKVEFTSGVFFDHTPHLTETRRGRKLRCTSCHSQIVQGEHISVTASTCFLCHEKNVSKTENEKLASCTACHVAPAGEKAVAGIYDHQNVLEMNVECNSCHKMMWQGTGQVLPERCGVCHSEAGHLEKINDLEFIHEWHIEIRKVDCQACHSPIEHHNSEPEMVINGDCRNCHDQEHSSMLDVYKGSTSKLIQDDMPDVMYSNGIICMSCHNKSGSHADGGKMSNVTCSPCHEESYLKLSKGWKSSFDKRISGLKSQTKLIKSPEDKKNVIHDLEILESGGAWHNPKYSSAILDKAEGIIARDSGRKIKSGKVNPANEKCLNCHNDILSASVQVKLSSFNHTKHIVDRSLSCNNCHQDVAPEAANHGNIKNFSNSCNNCHHSTEMIDGQNCAPCHQASSILYSGEVPGIDSQPSSMFESEMACTDCHLPDSEIIVPKDEFCMDCHDQEIVDQLASLRSHFSGELKRKDLLKGDAASIVIKDPGRAVHNPELAKKILEK